LQLVTMDETWFHHYDPETKQQSLEWQHSGSPHPKRFWVQKSFGKVLASVFWDQDGILLIDYLPKGQTFNMEYYSALLVQLKDILKVKRCQGHQEGLVLVRQCLSGLPLSWSPNLFSRYGPVGLPLVPWNEKTIERSPFFVQHGCHCCRGDLVGRTTVWMLFELEQ
jgi:hypothetical protein